MAMARRPSEQILTCFQASVRGYLVRSEVRRARGDFEDIVAAIDGGLTHVVWREAAIPVPHFTDTDGPLPRPGQPPNARRGACASPQCPSSSSSAAAPSSSSSSSSSAPAPPAAAAAASSSSSSPAAAAAPSSSSSPAAAAAAASSSPAAAAAAPPAAAASSSSPAAAALSEERGAHCVLLEKVDAERDDSHTDGQASLPTHRFQMSTFGKVAGVLQKESTEVEKDGDSTTAWSSLEFDLNYGPSHKGPRQCCSAQEACTPEALRLYRNSLTMELVWLQQAIDSRKKYLSLKDRLSES